MHLVIVGAGAIGTLFAARLIRAGTEVRLVARGSVAPALRSAGLRLDDPGPESIPVDAVAGLELGTETDGILLAVKAYDVYEATRGIAASLVRPAPFLTVQNGLGIVEEVERALSEVGWDRPRDWIVQGVNSMPATGLGPGHSRPGGWGEVLLADVGRGHHAAVFVGPLERAGIPAREVSDLSREVWRKLIVNAAINPVTADHAILNGDLVRDPWRQQSLALLREALAVARAEGFSFTDSEIEQDLWRVVRATAPNLSSMRQDLERGRRTEIDAISGAIVAAGRRHGVPLPATERIVRRIHAKEPGAGTTRPRADVARSRSGAGAA
jgi:2-dehydropantoate 2-reductase